MSLTPLEICFRGCQLSANVFSAVAYPILQRLVPQVRARLFHLRFVTKLFFTVHLVEEDGSYIKQAVDL